MGVECAGARVGGRGHVGPEWGQGIRGELGPE